MTSENNQWGNSTEFDQIIADLYETPQDAELFEKNELFRDASIKLQAHAKNLFDRNNLSTREIMRGALACMNVLSWSFLQMSQLILQTTPESEAAKRIAELFVEDEKSRVYAFSELCDETFTFYRDISEVEELFVWIVQEAGTVSEQASAIADFYRMSLLADIKKLVSAAPEIE